MREENTYIMNLEGAYIYKSIDTEQPFSIKNRDLNKVFSATIPYSLETIRMDEMCKKIFYVRNNKQYTKNIINVTFDKHYTLWDDKNKKKKIIKNRKKIREYLYSNGFAVDGKKYVFYKRGAGKAKNGYAFFIQEDLKDKLIKRSRLGLDFSKEQEIDFTSLLAYESLITSEIKFTINLDPKTEILLIDDIYGKEFESLASVTSEKNGEITTQNEIIKLRNCLSDGQGLLDESEFEKAGKKDKAFMLLRNDMLKDCAFNTKLQKWFKENNITKLTDMFGNIYQANKVKLIITPNSLKFLKFAYKFESEKECYNYWRENVDSKFGVVKCDKQGNYGNYNRTTYQLLNSIPNLTEDELKEIAQLEIDYVNLLKNDDAVFRNYIVKDHKLNYEVEESLNNGDFNRYKTLDNMNSLFLVNADVQRLPKFKRMKNDLINNYIDNLKLGKLRIKDAKYLTLISNPYEMLLSSIGKYDGKSIMQGREVWCPYYKDKQEFCMSRNPHINAGNVMYSKNKYHKEYDWFNFNENICVINFYDVDTPDRLQGCDTGTTCL